MPKITRPPQQLLLHLLFIVILVVSNSSAKRPPPNVQINKCCRIGEYYDVNNDPPCTAGTSEKWAPLIYMIALNRQFEPHGDFPKFFTINQNTQPETCGKVENFTGDLAIFSNGTLYIPERTLTVMPVNYCIDKNIAIVCTPKIHGADPLIAPKKSQVKKCCGPNAFYDRVNKTCEFISDKEHPFYDKKILHHHSDVEVIYGFPDCKPHSLFGKFNDSMLNIETGTIQLTEAVQLEPKSFCLEHIAESANEHTVNLFTCGDKIPAIIDVLTETAIDPPDIRYTMYSVGLFISVVFLIATLIAGFLMPTKHHVLHWKCQMYYIFCLLIGDFLLGLSQIADFSKHSGHCISLAVSIHFFFLAAFFWLNTMCFNIWWTFRDFRPTSLEKNQEVVRLRFYCVYAWGIPLLICCIASILDNIPASPGDNFLRPRFGENKCWFYGDYEIFAYFFGPIGILLFINLMLFASTTRQLTCGLWKLDDVKSTTERTALGKVCLKLVVVMGITWIADLISWIVGGPDYFWYVTDLINALQGVLIFIVVGCQTQVWSAIKRLWNSKTGRQTTTMTTNGPQHSNSSHGYGLPSLDDSVTNNTNTTCTKVPMETVC
ncbi:hypothetical protein ACFFRR_010665 [Megaselia abdita]